VNTTQPRDAWHVAVVALTALLGLTFFLYKSTVLYLVEKWNQLELGEYGHGYLVLLISAYLIFYNRHRLVDLSPYPEYRAIIAVLVSSMVWLTAALVDIEVLQAVGLLMQIMSIIWLLLGTQVLKVLSFPLFFISFAIPVWFPLSPILQGITADVVFWLIRLIEIPASRIDNMIVLPAGRLSIEEACSGLRYFLAALTLGTLFAYLNYSTFKARVIVVLVSVSAGVLANILRVFIVVYLGYTTDMQHPLITDHLMFGWYLFGGIVAVLLVIDAYLHRRRMYSSSDDTHGAVVTQSPCNHDSCNIVKSQFLIIILSCVLLVSAGPAVAYWMNNQSTSNTTPEQLKLASTIGEWSAMEADDDGWNPLYRGAINRKINFYNKNSHVIHVYLGIYPSQRQGEELINDLNRISDGKVWRAKYQSAKKVNNNNGQQVLEQLLEKNDGSQRLVWYWYHVAGHNTVNKYKAKALQALGLLQGVQQASIVALSTTLEGEPESTRLILGGFSSKLISSMNNVND